MFILIKNVKTIIYQKVFPSQRSLLLVISSKRKSAKTAHPSSFGCPPYKACPELSFFSRRCVFAIHHKQDFYNLPCRHHMYCLQCLKKVSNNYTCRPKLFYKKHALSALCRHSFQNRADCRMRHMY